MMFILLMAKLWPYFLDQFGLGHHTRTAKLWPNLIVIGLGREHHKRCFEPLFSVRVGLALKISFRELHLGLAFLFALFIMLPKNNSIIVQFLSLFLFEISFL